MGRRTGADAVPQSFHVWPDIQVNGSPLSHELEGLVEQVIVDHHQQLPDMFAIAFHDPDRNVLGTLGASIGDSVTIKVTPPGGSPETLIKGELTGFEAEYGATRLRTVLRGYDKSHRLHRGRRTETYKNVTDSDNAGPVAADSLHDNPGGLANNFGGPTFTAVNRPLAQQAQVDGAAASIAELISSAFAEADGVANGNPKLKAGSTVSIGVVGNEFSGKYTLTSARHVFGDHGYRTHFAISGRQDRTLLGLTSLGSSNGHASAGGAPINGVVVALVTDNNDPNNGARVNLKISLNETNSEIHISSQGKVHVESQQDMTFESQANLKLSAQQGITLEAQTNLNLKGSSGATLDGGPQLEMKSSGQTKVSRAMVDVNNGALQLM